MSAPKLGDKYATIGDGLERDSVCGPFYVVRVVKSCVALSNVNVPDRKASLDWRTFGDSLMGRDTWSTRHAVPWTDETSTKAAQWHLSRKLYEKAKAMASKPYETSVKQYRAALAALMTEEKR